MNNFLATTVKQLYIITVQVSNRNIINNYFDVENHYFVQFSVELYIRACGSLYVLQTVIKLLYYRYVTLIVPSLGI